MSVKLLVALSFLQTGWLTLASAQESASSAAAVKIEPSLNIRYRVEVVNQTPFTEQAVASTVRTHTGLEDRSFTAETRYRRVQYVLHFHRFRSGRGPTDFGNKLDFLLNKRWEHHALSLKYACFQTSSFGTKTAKLWTWYEYSV